MITRRSFLAQASLACAASGHPNFLGLSSGQGTSIAKESTRSQTVAGTSGPTARETISLDGTWQIIFDRKNEGRGGRWQEERQIELVAGGRPIEVPNCWETIEQDYEGVGWYGRRFQVPAAWNGRSVRVRFGAVNYRAEVWINGHSAGFHEGGYTPFEFKVDDLLHPGAENFIAVRVIGPIITQNLVIDGIGPNEMPHWRGAIAGGIWQSVELIATSLTSISDLFVEPDIHSSVATVHATIVNDGPHHLDAVLQLGISETGEPVKQQLELRPGNNVVKIEVHIPNARLWTPDDPHLYNVEARLVVSQIVCDGISRRFGMREFTIGDGKFLLNGKKIFVKAGFWEGFYPGTLAFPSNSDIVRREILLAKEAGFNLLRPWRKPPVPMILDIADEMGIMIIDAPAIECMGYWPQITPETDERVATEIREMVLRDRNHPSIVCWEMFNEILRPELKRLKQSMSVMARKLDGSRIVIDESGGWRYWTGETSEYPPYSFEGEPVHDYHSYMPAPVSSRTYDFYLNLGKPDLKDDGLLRGTGKDAADAERLVFVSEVGYGGLPDLQANVKQYDQGGNPLTPDFRQYHKLLAAFQGAMREMKWDEMFSDVSALCLASQRVQADGNKLMLEALRLNPHVAGYCLHAYTDGDWVLGAGVLDLFRNPKLVYNSLKVVQKPLYLAIRLDRTNVRAEEPAQMTIKCVNDGDAVSGTLQIEVVGPANQIVHKEDRPVSVSTGIQQLMEIKLPRLASSGTHKVRVSFQASKGGDRFANELEFYSLAAKDLKPPTRRLSVLDPGAELTHFLDARGIGYDQFSETESGMPVFVTVDTAHNEETFLRFVHLVDYVERGGVAVLLKPPLARTPRISSLVRKAAPDDQNSLLRTELFPLNLRSRPANGNWDPVNHGVRSHPVFEGLPVDGFMGQIYQNVVPVESIHNLKVPPIVGSISIDNPSGNKPIMNYHGSSNVWWGADLVAVPFGKGQFILSTLAIQQNLEADPVAEKILYNLVRWATSISNPVPAAGPDLQEKIATFMAKYRSLGKQSL